MAVLTWSTGSFLCSIHNRTDLADALRRYCEIVAEGAPEGWKGRALPSPDSINGTLRAIEDQTEAFNSSWWGTLSYVAAQLTLPEVSMYETLDPVILRGLMSTLPRVQQIKDQLLQIQTHNGVCCIVIWAHHILGLTVLVKIYRTGSETKEVRFGAGQQSVIVEYYIRLEGEEAREPTATLLLPEKDSKEQIFTLKPETDDGSISGIYKHPAQGHGRRLLERYIGLMDGLERVISELGCIACAYAVCISRKLCVATPKADEGMYDMYGLLYQNSENDMSLDDTEQSEDARLSGVGGNEDDVVVVPENRIVDAARLLLNNGKLVFRDFSDHIQEYSNKPLWNLQDGPPRSVRQYIDKWEEDSKLRTDGISNSWTGLQGLVLELSLVILAFANITDVRTAAELPIAALNTNLDSMLLRRISQWDGKSFIAVNENVWFEIITYLMFSLTGETTQLEDLCLISDRGWSVFTNTFGHADPYNLGRFATKS